MMEGVLWRKGQRGQTLPPRAVRLVVDRPAALIHHDFTLGIELLLGHCRQELAHTIRLEPECQAKLVRWNGLEVIRPIEPCRSVEGSTRPLNQLEMLVRLHVCRSLKEHVLEEVGEPSSAGAFIG
jgi:hypothetical protein